LRLDHLRLALVQWFTLSLARTVKLNDPSYTGLTRFLADGPNGSSGVMVLEYTSASALESLRQCADPVTRHTTTISMGTEDHAPYATQSVFATQDAIDAARMVVACELITAVRAARKVDLGPSATKLVERCSTLPVDTSDRSLTSDIQIALSLLSSLATVFDLG
jgi:histidine ammonia-lyase